jgi:hypothetical protein
LRREEPEQVGSDGLLIACGGAFEAERIQADHPRRHQDEGCRQGYERDDGHRRHRGQRSFRVFVVPRSETIHENRDECR